MKFCFDIADRSTSDQKDELYRVGIDILREFAATNELTVPHLKVTERIDYYGGYRRGTIAINLRRCRAATKTPGFAWTYPGYKSDLTPLGVLAHEMGHALEDQLPDSATRSRIVSAFKGESRVTSYEPNYSEALAEAVKLFITNPNLLMEGRPKRYEFLTVTCGLSPVQELKWDEVLLHAHPKFKAAAQNWMKR